MLSIPKDWPEFADTYAQNLPITHEQFPLTSAPQNAHIQTLVLQKLFLYILEEMVPFAPTAQFLFYPVWHDGFHPVFEKIEVNDAVVPDALKKRWYQYIHEDIKLGYFPLQDQLTHCFLERWMENAYADFKKIEDPWVVSGPTALLDLKTIYNQIFGPQTFERWQSQRTKHQLEDQLPLGLPDFNKRL